MDLVVLTAGHRLDQPLTRLRDWVSRRTAGALGWVFAIVGGFLVIDAVQVLGERNVLGG